MNCHHGKEDHYEEMHKHLRQHLLKMTDGADIRGLELSSLIRLLANYYAGIITQKNVPGELSGPRMGILIRLMVAENSGKKGGINPTALSQFQNVKKNTMSSLLRGLEESGLIERNMDPNDKRVFLIRISDAGKKLLETTGPKRLLQMNDLASDLSDEEKNQLIFLLEKLRNSMKKRADFPLRSTPEMSDDTELQ